MSGVLYLVATPIGNLGDISPRAAATLAGADFIAAEDTRVTLKLLNHLNIKKPLVSYYEHNRLESGEKIVARLLGGESCALVTDAGTPAVSDPGEDLVRQCAQRGVEIISIPGPCAAVAALAASGLGSGRFAFEGFLSTSRRSRAERLDELKDERRAMIFYEAPHKLRRTLSDMLAAFGDRRVSISRELTKLHEETLRLTLSDAAALFEEKEPRGEFVLVVEGRAPEKTGAANLADALTEMKRLMAEGSSVKDAARIVSEATGAPKNALYEAAISESGGA
ncbi:MAG: 16S rRNA (cytidine(1402)-2'-O)-methyltransferase [Oscillospiraceae bacterium]|jgi:16S rRNA (cytidine1402-2'-O)-methyltransferase|nr:16S rRNA (cytidine(1402)-2'-O)-methyltransferase [Oscillospiraceae bacterium]